MAAWISSTKFGSITIGGKDYEHDVIVTWEGEVKEAKAKTRHVLGEAELAELLLERPEIIVLGTGQSGCMELSPEVVVFAEKKKLKIVEKPMPQAVKEFNELVRLGKRVVAYMHVTC